MKDMKLGGQSSKSKPCGLLMTKMFFLCSKHEAKSL